MNSNSENDKPTENTGAFKVTPENYSAEVTVKEEVLQDAVKVVDDTPVTADDIVSYINKAKDDGYAASLVDAAVKLSTKSNCATYADFDILIEKVMSESIEREADEIQRQNRVKQSIRLEVARLRKNNQIGAYSDELIVTTYNTRSVITADILAHATEEQLNLELYEEPVFSIILQIQRDWVKEIVEECMSNWETKEFPRMYINNYLDHLGVEEQDREKNREALLKALRGTAYEHDAAPDTFKEFIAVQLILKQRDPISDVDLSDKILSQPKSMIEYDAQFEDAIEDGNPAQAATAYATEKALESISDVNEVL